MLTSIVVISAALTAVAVVVLIVLLHKVGAYASQDAESALRDELRVARKESADAARSLREEVSQQQKATNETLVSTIAKLGEGQKTQLESVTGRIEKLTESNEARLDKTQRTLDERLKQIQESNENRLDQMRKTVDEKLQITLERRLGESFKMVSENLEAVQKGLGEMRSLASGVGDLKRVLTNVKARGTWGEVQLGALLEEILTPEQYGRNVQTKAGSREAVEYAVRLPGPGNDPDACVWLPIDAKFPQEDYLRVVEASEAGDSEALQRANSALLRALHSSAKDIRDKYLNPPATTDFAIMFLPTEGLYAEILRQAGQVEVLQRDYRIVVAGPTTLSALLSSLRMGFRTLAIEKRSSEVWQILRAVKTEFGRFGDVLRRLQNQLESASKTIEVDVGRRTRAMERKLRSVEQLPADQAKELLGLPEQEAGAGEEEEEEEEDSDR
jgi:DNA recombination protein RmuC